MSHLQTQNAKNMGFKALYRVKYIIYIVTILRGFETTFNHHSL